jgi:hypothetical protein
MSMAVLKCLANRIFVTGLYHVTKEGSVEAEIPHRCPQARLDGTCRIKKFGTRERAFGAPYPFRTCLCVAHNYHFTVYPPGWFPYARNPIVQLAPDGKPIEIVHTDTGSEEASPWSFTIFKSVIAAAAGRLWPEEKQLGVADSPLPVNYHGVARTQKRGIKFFMKTFGLLKTSHHKLREKVCDLLGIEMTTLPNSKEKMNTRSRGPPLWQVRGGQGKEILETLAASANTSDKLLYLMQLA